ACIYCDNLISSDLAGISGNADLIRLANHDTGTMDNVIDVYGPNVTNLFLLSSCMNGGMVSTDIGATAIFKTACKSIRINIDGTTYYLLASTAVGTS
ncbi:unnamed protein product, partial [marine sediment metagenome]